MKWPQEFISEATKILNEIHSEIVSPSKEDALRFFEINPEEIKVIILGQDPYPTPGVANGIAFAVNEDVKIPQSLRNIFKEIDEIKGSHVADRTLKHWQEQGILLLNTSLTVEHYKPNSHKRYWKPFTDKLILWMSNNLDATWVLWGNEAKKYKSLLGNNRVIEDAHPSPLSVRRRNKQTFVLLKDINL